MHARTLEAKKSVKAPAKAAKVVSAPKLSLAPATKIALAPKLVSAAPANGKIGLTSSGASVNGKKTAGKASPAAAAPVAPVVAPVVGAFKVGDHAVYPARGVAEIVSIEDKDIAGKRQSFYVLRLLDTDHKIMVPVANAASIGLRKPINEGDIRRIFQILKVKDVPIDTQTWNRRQRAFVEKLSTGSVFEVAEVMRDLERVKDVKDALSFSERQMLERARQLLIKEIAVSRNKPDESVRAQIDALFAAASRANARSN